MMFDDAIGAERANEDWEGTVVGRGTPTHREFIVEMLSKRNGEWIPYVTTFAASRFEGYFERAKSDFPDSDFRRKVITTYEQVIE